MRKYPVHALIAFTAFILLSGRARGESATLQQLTDERDVVRITNEIDLALDDKDWDRARSMLADEVNVDFTSLVGGKPGTVKADDMVKSWKSSRRLQYKTLRIRGNHVATITGDKAVVMSNGYSWSRTGHGLWELGGRYVHEMVRTPKGWRINAMTFTKVAERILGHVQSGNALPPALSVPAAGASPTPAPASPAPAGQ